MLKAGQTGVGVVETHTLVLDEGVRLDCGARLRPVTVAYESYGRLNGRRDNTILVCHALSGGAHAAGCHPGATKPGWWDTMIGPGRAFDTDRYCVISSNVLGSCYGTTGPASADPTGRPLGARFPVVTIADMVRTQRLLLDHLGIGSLLAVAGGSMGGMQALQWAASYPDSVRSVVALATTWRHSAQQIAFDEVARQAVMTDPAWKGGDYYETGGPQAGLAVARMLGHITYLSDPGMTRKFGRRLRGRERLGYTLDADFEVESYLHHQGESFVGRFDANSLIYLSKAMDYFDLPASHPTLAETCARAGVKFLFLTFSSDWLYPPSQLAEVAASIREAGGEAAYREIPSDCGHDAFLLEDAQQTPLIHAFLEVCASGEDTPAARPNVERGEGGRPDLESCLVARKGGDEALTGARVGRVVSREIFSPPGC